MTGKAAFVLTLLVVLGALDLLKGLDFEEAVLSWAGAAALWWGRDTFYVQQERGWNHRPVWLFAGAVGLCTAGVGVLVWLSTGRTAEPRAVLGSTIE